MQSPRAARVRGDRLCAWERSTRPATPGWSSCAYSDPRRVAALQPRRPGVEPYLDAESGGQNTYREEGR